MSERAFIKSCIKVAGLLLLIWGTLGLVSDAFGYGAGWVLQKKAIAHAENADSETAAKSAIMQVGSNARMMSLSLLKLPMHIVYVLTGLYLCRRYHRLLRWLLKDEPTT